MQPYGKLIILYWHEFDYQSEYAGFTVILGIYPDIFLEGITGYMNGVLGGGV